MPIMDERLDTATQLRQICEYLQRMSLQLAWAFTNIEEENLTQQLRKRLEKIEKKIEEGAE